MLEIKHKLMKSNGANRADSPRYRRGDLLGRLQRGDQRRIAQMAGCSTSSVSAVLNGMTAQDTKLAEYIIRVTERVIETNRFRR
ncbi:MAG: hypothetical protein SNI70_11400 [Rikenellaceae bacterium]